jgi:hypothetical protein
MALMAHAGRNRSDTKVSPQFAARLSRLKPKDQVRLIVLLATAVAAEGLGRRRSRAERDLTVDATRQSAESALHEVDRILERFHGHRVAAHLDALAGITVEAPLEAINALAACKYVKAILEDQAIAPLPIARV